MLGLDPGVDDDELIRTRVGEVVAFWRKEQSSPRYKGLVSSLLRQQDAISAQLLDPGRRAEARARVQGAAAAADEATAARVDELLDTLERRHGGIPRDRLDRLRSLAATLGITAEQIDARLADRTIIDPAEAAGVDPVPAPTRRQVAGLLTELARLDPDGGTHRTLHGFLGLPPTADANAVATRCEALEARNRQRRHDRLRTVVDELLAQSRTLLVEGDPRRYLAGVEADVRDELRPAIETAVLLEDKVGAAETDRLTREAVSAGIAPTAARELVIDVARSVGAPIDVGAAPDYVVCATCNAANVPPTDATSAECTRCGAELFRPCPRCGHRDARSDVRCGACRFDLRAYDEAADDLARAAEDLDAGRLGAALDRIDAAAAWSDDLPDVQRLRDRAAAAGRAADDAWANLLAALDARRVDDARRYATAVGRVAADRPGPDGVELAATEVRVAALEAELAEAIAAAGAGSGADREAALVGVLDRFPGASAVAEALVDVGVQPVTDVVATTDDGGVSVRWDPSPSPGPIEYRVERVVERTGGATTPLGRVRATEVEDAGAPAGEAVRYSVVAARLGIPSPPALSEPVVVTPEIGAVEVLEHDGAVELRWPAVRVGDVWVERTEADDGGTPRTLRAGPTGMLDTAVRSGTRYRYRVGVQYPGGAGAMPARTAGRSVEAVAFALPDAPPAPVVAPQGRSLTLSVPPPDEGVAAVVLRATAPPAVAPGTEVDEAGLRSIGGALAGRDGTGFDAADGGPRWYVAAHVVRGRAVVGPAVAHPGVTEAERVRIDVDADGPIVRWDWPAACTEAVVHWTSGPGPLEPGGPGVHQHKVTNVAYEVAEGFRPAGVAGGPLEVVVLAAGRIDGALVPLPAWSPTAHAAL